MNNFSSKLWHDDIFKPYFIVRYGYKISEYNEEIRFCIDKEAKSYENEVGFFDSITILNSGELNAYYSHIAKVGFALINNHFLPNEYLPKQYCCEDEIAIISHEFLHSLGEILIYLFFQNFTKKQISRSYTALGEGLLLGIQDICLKIRTHYGNHKFTSYLLIGKAFSRWFMDEIEVYNKKIFTNYNKSIKPLSEMVQKESNNIKNSFFKLRDNFIALYEGKVIDNFSNDFIIQIDFREYIPILKQYSHLQLLREYILPEFKESVTKIITEVPIENPASDHKPIGSGYINYYLVDADQNGNLTYKNTLYYLNQGLKIFCSNLEEIEKPIAQEIIKDECQKDLILEKTLDLCFNSLDELFEK